MGSQLNKQSENNEQVFSEFSDDHFRTNFFDSSKRVLPSSNDSNKRAKLDASVTITNHSSGVVSPTPLSPTATTSNNRHHHHLHPNTSNDSPVSPSGTPTTESTPSLNALSRRGGTPLIYRRFRSRSLPILHHFNSRQQIFAYNQQISKNNLVANALTSSNSSILPPPLPPVNLQSLKEIDLTEILKNPQLRHDILFDPQLQFRPNLDGERGKRKKANIDKYWNDVEKECKEIFANPSKFNAITSRIPTLFNTLRDILLSLLPSRDREAVSDIMDTDLLIQQLSRGVFDFVSLAEWLSNVFKSHCAPMRDAWVTEMAQKFVEAEEEKSISKLIMGLRMNFSILEAMKLDVANHQIRILRPMLIETAVEFERDYFSQIISRCKLDLSDSLNWYNNSFNLKSAGLPNGKFKILNKTSLTSNLRNHCVSAILDLLSCRNMVNEFPSTLTFDTNRLVLLRADVRQQVCIEICVLYYKQLIFKNPKSSSYRSLAFSDKVVSDFKKEILAIVTDDNGNVKWTRNVYSVALQIVKRSILASSLEEDEDTDSEIEDDDYDFERNRTNITIPEKEIDLAYGWLMKQIQPTSAVYASMEDKIFDDLLNSIVSMYDNISSAIDPSKLPQTLSGNLSVPSSSYSSSVLSPRIVTKDEEIKSISEKVAKLAKFHWDVFGSYYTEAVSRK